MRAAFPDPPTPRGRLEASPRGASDWCSRDYWPVPLSPTSTLSSVCRAIASKSASR
jgi:hypothetical protein